MNSERNLVMKLRGFLVRYFVHVLISLSFEEKNCKQTWLFSMFSFTIRICVRTARASIHILRWVVGYITRKLSGKEICHSLRRFLFRIRGR